MTKSFLEYPLPGALREMPAKELELLSYEVREFLLEHVSKTGGHLASNLGVVELTIALHAVFESPKDKIIWDVGHQSYAHKLLTGRGLDFPSLRQLDGLSGFPKREESPHDCFNTGHSSSSLSIAAGFAAARDLQSEKYSVIAVIGDGALTGGLAYEALNNLVASRSITLIIINDNEMSIGKNTGGVSRHLSDLRMSRTYLDVKKQVKTALKHIPGLGKGLYSGMEHIKDSLKYAFVDGAFFEELGFKFFGPVDGHDIGHLIDVLSIAKEMEESVIIHVLTQKGKGYKNAEKRPDLFHGTGPFDLTTGQPTGGAGERFYTDVFGEKLVELAEKDEKIVAISAAMIEGSGLAGFKDRFPNRIFDVGIAEAHGVTFAAAMALQGLRPVVAIYSTFLQRGYDQILTDVCLQNLPVVFAIDRAGVSGRDGETHQGIFDLSYLGHMPNLTILSPKDGPELASMLEYAFSLGSPCAIRYSKRALAEPGLGEGSGPEEAPIIKTGKSKRIATGKDVEIWALGDMVRVCEEALGLLKKMGIKAGLVNARFAKPIDEKGLSRAFAKVKRVVTIEDNVLQGGFGSEAAKLFSAKGADGVKLLHLGWPDRFVEHGGIEELCRRYSLDAASVAERIRGFVEGEA